MPQADIACAVSSIFCSVSKTMWRHIATPSRRLPAKTCHRQLLRNYVDAVKHGIHIFSFKRETERKDGKNKWQSII